MVLAVQNQQDQHRMKQRRKKKVKFGVKRVGIYPLMDHQHHLKVKDAAEIQQAQSCHLLDWLADIEREAKPL